MKKLLKIIMLAALIAFGAANVSAEEKYSVDEIFFSDLAGKLMETPLKSCVVNARVTKNSDDSDENTIVIASYATDGKLIGFSTMSGVWQNGMTAKFSASIETPEDKKLGMVKAYVWDNIFSMNPLSVISEKKVNEMTGEPEEPIKEKFVPDKIMVKGDIIGTPNSKYILKNNEYEIYINDVVLENSDIKSETDYINYDNRKNAVLNVYDIRLRTQYRFESDIDISDYLYYNGYITLSRTDTDGDGIFDNIKITDFEQSPDNVIEEFDADTYVGAAYLLSEHTYSQTGKIRFGSEYYTMNDEVELYVNGYPHYIEKFGRYTSNIDSELENYMSMAQGIVRMIKKDGDSGFSSIFIDCYEIAEVTGVTYKRGQTTIDYLTVTPFTRGTDKLVIDDDKIANGETAVYVIRNGNDVELRDLAEGDIIAFAADFYEVIADGNIIENPRKIEISASDRKVSGVVTGMNDEEEVYFIDDAEYKCVEYNPYDYGIGNSYIFKFDPFGRIAKGEESAVLRNYAIAEMWKDSSEKVRLVLADGTMREYELGGNISVSDIQNIIYENGDATGNKKPVQDRVVEYMVKNSTGAISYICAEDPRYSYDIGNKAEYIERSKRLGSARISSDTKIIDASEYTGAYRDYAAFNKSELKDGKEYGGYVYQLGTYAEFVVLTDMGEVFDEESRFAVVRKSPQQEIYDGDNCYKVNVLYGGEEMDLYLEYNNELAGKLHVGDAFYFEKDRDGFVTDVYVVYDANAKVFLNFMNAGVASDKYKINTDGWNFEFYDDGHSIKLVYGIITNDFVRAVEFGLMDYGEINTNIEGEYNRGVYTYGLGMSSDIYVYNSADENIRDEYRRIYCEDKITASNINAFETNPNSGIFKVDTDEAQKSLNYGLAMIVDGEIKQIYNIINDETGRNYVKPAEEIKTNYAIAEKWNDSDKKVQLVLADGRMKEYEVDENITSAYINEIIYGNADGTRPENPLQNRVVEYTVRNSTGTISDICAVHPNYFYNKTDKAKYNAGTEKLGSARIASGTKIIDASQYEGRYSDYEALSSVSLYDGEEYEAYIYQSGAYADFILILAKGDVFDETSRFAVVRKSPQPALYEGETCYKVNVLYEGEETNLYLEYNTVLAEKLKIGDAFYFEKNRDGFLTDVYVVYHSDEEVFQNFMDAGVASDKYKINEDGWRFNLYDDGQRIALVYGIVTGVSSKTVEFGVINDNLINTDIYNDMSSSLGVYEFSISPYAQRYIYDIGDTKTLKEYEKIGIGDVIKSNLGSYKVTESEYYINPEEAKYVLNYAVAMIVDGEIVEIYEITK